MCWHCWSQEWHRTLWLFLRKQRPGLLDAPNSLLHFAPEPGLESYFRKRKGLDYVTCDLEPGKGELVVDVMAIDLPDSSFDAIICSHVLEHVEDDRQAMRELHRVLSPLGWCIVIVPVSHDLTATDEDPQVTHPRERMRRFWSDSHVRLYSLDIVDRLGEAGFEVEHIRPTEEIDPAAIARYRLGSGDDVFLCRKPG
jgi:SAM-dependent methyltransferase